MRLQMPLIVLGLLVALSCSAQDKVQLFGGISYVRASVEVQPAAPLAPCPPNCALPARVDQSANLTGWDFSAAYRVIGPIGLVGDFGGQYGNTNGAITHLNTYLVGVQASAPLPFSPFVHALAGLAHESVGVPPSAAYESLGSSTSRALALGGGLDAKLLPFLSLRLIQIDYLYTHFYNARQNQPRISAGIVVHF